MGPVYQRLRIIDHSPRWLEVLLAFLVSQHTYSMTQLVTIASIGNTLGALSTWWLGVWIARKYPVESLLNDKHQRSLSHVKRWGNWALLFSWLPVVGDGLCFASGWLKLSFLSAFCAIFLGKVIRYFVVAYAFV